MKSKNLLYGKNIYSCLVIFLTLMLGMGIRGTGQPGGTYDRPQATITSTATGGAWTATGTWVGGVVPSASSDVIIAGPVSVNTAASCLSLTVNAGKTLTLAATQSLTTGAGGIINSGTILLTAGTNATNTLLTTSGNVTNNAGATLNAKAGYTRFSMTSANAQTFTNNGTVTTAVACFEVANSNASGLTLAGSNGFVIVRANLLYGTIFNSNKITLGSGGNSSAVVQRGMSSTAYPAGNFNVAPVFNIGIRGLSLLYDDGSVPYTTGYEVPSSLSVDYVTILDAADVTLNSDITVLNDLSFAGSSGTPTLRIGTHTLTAGGTITYNVSGSFNGGTTSNLVMNGSNVLNGISGGLNNFTINANTTLAGPITVNGTLTLSGGILAPGPNLTMASGSTISRSGGSLFTAPTFAGTVNLVYTGSTPVITGKELPSVCTCLNNLTSNPGGVTQFADDSVTTQVFTDDFPDLANWNGSKGSTSGHFDSFASSNAGGTAPEVGFIGSTSHGNTSYSINRGPINTTGFSMVNISFAIETEGYYPPNVTSYLKLQSATSSGGPWHDVWVNTYSESMSAQVISVSNYSTDVGGNMYFQFVFAGDYYALDNWYFDDLFVDGVTTTPVPSTATVNGTLNLANGPYAIGTNNTLVLNGGVSGSNPILGGTTCNLTVGGTAANLVMPAITDGLNNFTINRPNGVSIPSTGNLTVNGVLANNEGTSGLVIKSDASGTGSLIHSTPNVPATVNLFLTTEVYHYISSPISNAISNIFVGDYLMTTDPTTATGWGSWIISTTVPLEVMRGYACWKLSTSTTSEAFSGNLNSGSQSISLNRDPSDPWAGWHMVGNPYPSSIDLASAGITWNNFEPTAYFWNGSVYLAYPTTGGYGTHSRYAPPEQGFFVHISDTYSGNTTLTITNAARVHNGELFLKDAPAVKNALLITAQGNNNSYYDKITVQFNPDATSGYDPGFDAFKLEGIQEAPQLYTLAGTTKVGCNALPFEQKNMILPMGFSCGLSGNYSLLAENLGTFDDAISIRLEDLKLNITQNLRTNPVYNFTYASTDDPDRFVLLFDDPTLGGTVAENVRPVNIYSYGSSVYIRSEDGCFHEGQAIVYDLAGRELFRKSIINQPLNRLTPDVTEGYYLVRVVTDNGSFNGKIYLK